MDVATNQRPVPLVAPIRAPRPVPRWGPARALAAAALVLLAAGALALAAGLRQDPLGSPAPAPAAAPVVVPGEPENGRIAFTIPRGAAESQARGGAPYVMPPVMRLQVGDAVVVSNADVAPHMVLNGLVLPGETTQLVFAEPGVHAFSSGCTANGGTMNSFTSVIVSERAT